MKRVLVVCTVHRETGLANVTELQAILERIRPEVVFLELPSADFDGYLDGTRETLESIAATRYRAIHPVALVPVDLPAPGDEFKRNIDYLFDRIEDASSEYRRLSFLNSQSVSAYGFAYLNSASSSTRWSAIQQAMRTTIDVLRDRRLVDLYTLWAHANDRREVAMINSIEDYAMQNPFNTGVLLVGLAHRQSIIDKSRLGYRDGLPRVRWDFEGFLDGSHGDGSS